MLERPRYTIRERVDKINAAHERLIAAGRRDRIVNSLSKGRTGAFSKDLLYRSFVEDYIAERKFKFDDVLRPKAKSLLLTPGDKITETIQLLKLTYKEQAILKLEFQTFQDQILNQITIQQSLSSKRLKEQNLGDLVPNTLVNLYTKLDLILNEL